MPLELRQDSDYTHHPKMVFGNRTQLEAAYALPLSDTFIGMFVLLIGRIPWTCTQETPYRYALLTPGVHRCTSARLLSAFFP